MSLFPSIEECFPHFKPLLLPLLGEKRSIPVFGNMRLFTWLIARVRPLIKTIRTKDMALFRALCALPTSFVKQGDKHYDLLSKAGYTPLEIAYANMRSIWLTPAADRLSWNSIVTEKVLVNLFKEVFRTEASITNDVYDQLAAWREKYETFPIKCFGQDKLLGALDCGETIKTPETFRWFSGHAPFTHGAFRGFDIMDSHWDSLAAAMEFKPYMELFETFLHEDMSTEDIKARISRFNLLTGRDYMKYGAERSCWLSFRLLVRKDVIDLWQAFQDSVDADGIPVKPDMIRHIRDVLRGMDTIQAFHFYESFLPRFGFQGLKTYFDNEHLFRDSVASCCHYYNTSRSRVELKLEQEYLDDDIRRRLLYWLSEYFFEFETEYYLPLIAEILDKEAVAGLFPYEEQRAMFDLAMAHPSFVSKSIDRLKKRYFTTEEKEAEQTKQAALKLERERQERLALEKEVLDKFSEISGGTMAALLNFAEEEYRFRSEKLEIANSVVCEYLLSMDTGRSMDESEYACLLKLCGRFVGKKKMRIAEAQKLITTIKEAPNYAESDPGSHAD